MGVYSGGCETQDILDLTKDHRLTGIATGKMLGIREPLMNTTIDMVINMGISGRDLGSNLKVGRKVHRKVHIVRGKNLLRERGESVGRLAQHGKCELYTGVQTRSVAVLSDFYIRNSSAVLMST